MPFLSHESVEDWVNRICNTFLWKELTQLTMKVSEPKVEGGAIAQSIHCSEFC